MFTRWLTFTAFLAGSANPERAAIGQGALTVTPTCRVKGQPEAELILNCGDGKKAGVVDYWHTPFGDFHTPNFHSKLDPVFMHHDGSLVVSNASHLHNGLYYCLLQHTEGTTLWPYELHVGPNHQRNHEHSGCEEGSRSDVLRFRRDVWSEDEKQAGGVSNGQFTAAVVASVLLTFVLGFSIGALSRTHVLRCLGSVTKKLQSPRRQQCQTEVTMATLPPMCDNQAFQMEQDDDSANGSRISMTSCPPAKPQRSFRHKRKEEVTTTYLEGCDYKKEEEVEEEEKGEEENYKGCEEEEGEFGSFYISGEDGRSETETDEDKCSEDREEEESREEKKECRREEEVEEGGEQENGSKEIGEERRSSEEEEEEGAEQDNRSKEIGQEKRSSEEEEEEEEAARGNEERWRDEKMEEERGGYGGKKERSEEDEETDKSRESEQSSGETDDEERGGRNREDTMESGVGGEEEEGEEGEEGGGRVGRKPGRRSRIIRLYQYNEDGERYCHLPAPASDPVPAPRLRQRSISLTRLSAIMAAASAGPLDASGETEGEERKEKAHFHMEI
ncbi:uncharacterized protein LOC122984060 [Scomber scombrus]|uniref:Uncharacterized protein LOC122984060 n=1 Tax=Scomber scombrus TaxID=13677 RepID=A0AAV1QBB2_SCOSC